LKEVFLLLLAAGFLASCAAQLAPTSLPSPAGEAQHVLIDFLTLLHTKNYAEANLLYGGEYESLQVFNPEIDPNDHMALWTWVCENKLLLCLEVRSAELTHQEGDTYVFQVEFTNPDGSQFVNST
jgi:hypothetical protein